MSKTFPLRTIKTLKSKRKSVLPTMETEVKLCAKRIRNVNFGSEKRQKNMLLFALLLSNRKRVLSKRATVRSPLMKSGMKPRRSIGPGKGNYDLVSETELDLFEIAL